MINDADMRPIRPEPVASKTETGDRLVRIHREIVTSIEEISPDLARKYIENQTENRPVSQRRVDDYERNMDEGRWMLNGETIVFDWFDRMVDGQHRCWACVQANKKFRSLVVRGVDPSTFVTMNTGDSRDSRDVLNMRGEMNVVVLAGILRLIWRWELYQQCYSKLTSRKGARKSAAEEELPISKRWGTRSTPSPREIEEVLTRHPNARRWASQVKINNKVIPGVPLGFVLYWLSCIGVPENSILAFKERLCEGAEMKANDPIFRCHKRFMEVRLGRAGGRRPINTLESCALIIKAWNHKLQGTSVGQILWRSNEDSFPEPLPME